MALLLMSLGLSACGGDGSAEDLYAMACAGCHGKNQEGVEGVGPDLTTGSFALEETNQWLTDRINHGFQEMPGFDRALSDAQVRLIVAYLRGGAPEPTTPPGPGDERLALGRRIYEVEAGGVGCASCHGSDAGGTSDGPNIIGVSKSAIVRALESVFDMEDIHLTPEEIDAVYRYVRHLSEPQ